MTTTPAAPNADNTDADINVTITWKLNLDGTIKNYEKAVTEVGDKLRGYYSNPAAVLSNYRAIKAADLNSDGKISGAKEQLQVTDTPHSIPVEKLPADVRKALMEKYIVETTKEYEQRTMKAAREKASVAQSPDKLAQTYQAMKDADLNGNGKLEGREEVAALISGLTDLEFQPFKNLKRSVLQACEQNTPKAVGFVTSLGYKYFAKLYTERNLAHTLAAGNPQEALEKFHSETSGLRNTARVHSRFTSNKILDDEARGRLDKALSDIDSKADGLVAIELITTLSTHPALLKEAQSLPEVGMLSPLPPRVTCAMVPGVRI